MKDYPTLGQGSRSRHGIRTGGRRIGGLNSRTTGGAAVRRGACPVSRSACSDRWDTARSSFLSDRRGEWHVPMTERNSISTAGWGAIAKKETSDFWWSGEAAQSLTRQHPWDGGPVSFGGFGDLGDRRGQGGDGSGSWSWSWAWGLIVAPDGVACHRLFTDGFRVRRPVYQRRTGRRPSRLLKAAKVLWHN